MLLSLKELSNIKMFKMTHTKMTHTKYLHTKMSGCTSVGCTSVTLIPPLPINSYHNLLTLLTGNLRQLNLTLLCCSLVQTGYKAQTANQFQAPSTSSTLNQAQRKAYDIVSDHFAHTTISHTHTFRTHWRRSQSMMILGTAGNLTWFHA